MRMSGDCVEGAAHDQLPHQLPRISIRIRFPRSSRPSPAKNSGNRRHQSDSSENSTHNPEVLAALGSVLTNKYCEGYPGRPVLRRAGFHGQAGERCPQRRPPVVPGGTRQRAAALRFAHLGRIGIATNKQVIPDDRNLRCGRAAIRIGTPACTTRGMLEGDMERIAGWIVEAFDIPKTPVCPGYRRT